MSDWTDEDQAALEALQSGEDAAEDTTEEVSAEGAEEAPETVEAQEPEAEEKPAEVKDSKPPEGFVPHQALHSEREKRKALEQRLAELEQRLPKPEEKPKPEWVDPLQDPDAARAYSQEMESRIETIQRQMQEREAAQARAAEVSRLEAQFQAQTPDYPDAISHLRDTRVTQLRNQGYSDQEIIAQVNADANAIYEAAQKMGINPAELAYFRAQQMGYRKAEERQQVAAQAKQMQAVQAAQEATRGLSASGAPPKSEISLEAVASMSDAQFEAFQKANPGFDFSQIVA